MYRIPSGQPTSFPWQMNTESVATASPSRKRSTAPGLSSSKAKKAKLTDQVDQLRRAVIQQKRANRPEQKSLGIQNGASGTTINDTTGITVPLSDINQGVDGETRIGIKVRLRRIEGWLFFKMHNSATKTAIRLILVRARGEKGVPPMISTNLAASAGAPYYALQYPGTRKIWMPIIDQMINLDNNGHSSHAYRLDLKLLGGVTQYEGSDAEPFDGGYYMYMVSNEGVNHPTVNFQTFSWFEDE